MHDNELKYQNYKEQFGRLNKALKNGFNLEAMFIEYAIMEDRTESILTHLGKFDACKKSCKNRGPNLNSKIKYIRKLAENKKGFLHKYFKDDLLDEILQWKDERNRIVHALVKQEFQHNELSDLALQGKELVSRLRSKSGCINRAIEKEESCKE